MTYKVGDTAYVETSKYQSTHGFKTTVKKVTPTGRVVVDSQNGNYEITFNSEGKERGSDNYHPLRLVSAERWTVIDNHMREKAHRKAIAETARQLAEEVLSGKATVIAVRNSLNKRFDAWIKHVKDTPQ